MTILTLGTHEQPFPRAVRIAASLARGEPLLVQHGSTPPDRDLPNVSWVELLGLDELTEAMREASLVVAHAGVGSIVLALRAGKRPVVIPRLAARGEHVDDHQVQIAKRLDERGLVVACMDEAGIEAAAERARQSPGALPRATALRAAVDEATSARRTARLRAR